MMATEERITFCRICEACCGMVATVEDGRGHEAEGRQGEPVLPGLRLPEGAGLPRSAERPRPGAAPPEAAARRHVRAGLVGRRPRRHRRPAADADRHPRRRLGRLLRREPDRLQLLGLLLDHRVHGRHQVAAPVHGGVGRHQQPVGGQRRPVRQPADEPDPRPRAAATSCSSSGRTPSSPTAACGPCPASGSGSWRTRSGAGGSSWSIPGAPRRPRPSSTCRSGPTVTPGCWPRCCR